MSLGCGAVARGAAPWCQRSFALLRTNVQPVAQKDQQLTVRVSQQEKREIERRAAEADLSVSRFLVKSALDDGALMSAGDRHSMVESLRDLYREIKSHGANLNQLTRHLNRGGNVDAEAINRASAATEQAADAIMEKLDEVT